RSTAVVTMAAWARWMPSKTPSATTDGLRSGGKDRRPCRIRMDQSLWFHPPVAREADADEGIRKPVHADRSLPDPGHRHRLTVGEAGEGGGGEPDRRQGDEGGVRGPHMRPQGGSMTRVAHLRPRHRVRERVGTDARADERGERAATAERIPEVGGEGPDVG